jgi:hypothetical protein
MEHTTNLSKVTWNKEKILTPLLIVMFVESVVLIYTIYSIPAVC